MMFICTSGGKKNKNKLRRPEQQQKKPPRLFGQTCKTLHTQHNTHCMYNNRICMIVIILNVTWSVYIFYNTLNTFFSPYRNNRTEQNAAFRHTLTLTTKIGIVESRFIFRFERLLLATECECARICDEFDFSVLFHAECFVVALCMCGCTIVVSSFYLRKKCLFKSSRTLTVFYLSFPYILYQ